MHHLLILLLGLLIGFGAEAGTTFVKKGPLPPGPAGSVLRAPLPGAVNGNSTDLVWEKPVIIVRVSVLNTIPASFSGLCLPRLSNVVPVACGSNPHRTVTVTPDNWVAKWFMCQGSGNFFYPATTHTLQDWNAAGTESTDHASVSIGYGTVQLNGMLKSVTTDITPSHASGGVARWSVRMDGGGSGWGGQVQLCYVGFQTS